MKGETGYILTITDFHPIAAAWKDTRHLEIITPGLRQQVSPTIIKSWAGINITYKLTANQ